METNVEQYVRKFVHSKTEEKVELHLTPNLHIRPVKKRGSILLAVFWANVLQHPNNFPKKKYSYKKVSVSLTSPGNFGRQKYIVCVLPTSIHHIMK